MRFIDGFNHYDSFDGTAACLERELDDVGFVFKGTGWYLYPNMSILVLPRGKRLWDKLWLKASLWGKRKVFIALVWDARFDQLLISQAATIPVQVDERP